LTWRASATSAAICQDHVCHGERGAQAAGIPATDVDDDLIVFRGQRPHLLPDRRSLKLDRGELVHRLLGPDLCERRRARLLVPIDQQHVAAVLCHGCGDIHGQHGFPDAALCIAYRKDHDDTRYSLNVHCVYDGY
jgi:hypothetical protein